MKPTKQANKQVSNQANNLTIIIDTREKHPYCFASFFPCNEKDGKYNGKYNEVRKALKTGDYSVVGYEDVIAVERKTLDDLSHSLMSSQSKSRFHAELERLSEMQYVVLLIEGSIEDVLSHNYAGSTPGSKMFEEVVGVMAEYGIPVVFAGDRQCAQRFVWEWMKKVSEK